MKNLFINTAVVALSLYGSSALAENISVLNQNFESDAIQPSTGFNSFISGWVNSGYGSIGAKAPLGDGVDYTNIANHGQVAFLNEGARLTQTVGADLQDGETYTLTFDAGRPKSESGQSYIVRFKANGLALAQLQVDGSAVTPGTWEQKSFSFTSDASMPIGKPIVIEFQNLAASTGNQVHIDNVKVSKAGTGTPLPIESLGDNGLDMVPVNLTLKVPESFATINDALDYMDNLHIRVGKTVTIKVSDCTNQIFGQPIEVDHPHGEYIHIVGDTSNPANCKLQFNGSTGFIADDNRSIGLIDGFHINGNDTADTQGVVAKNGANITLGTNMWVSNFENGVQAEKNGRVFAEEVTSFGHTGSGFYAYYNGLIQASGANSYDNTIDGYRAHHSGQIYADYALAQNNLQRGFFGLNSSYISANYASSTSSGNEGFYATDSSAVVAQNASAIEFNPNGFRAYYLSHFDRSGNNTTSASPGIGAGGNSYSWMK